MTTNRGKIPESMPTSKLHDAQGCIVDAMHLVDLIEIAADGPDQFDSGTIAGVVRVAGEKLSEAMELLDEAQRIGA